MYNNNNKSSLITLNLHMQINELIKKLNYQLYVCEHASVCLW